MVEVEVLKDVNYSAEKIWKFLNWRGVGDIRGDTFFERITFDDDLNEAGAVRVIHLPDGSTIPEIAEEIDDEAMRIVYRPLDLGSLPAKDYIGRIKVTPLGADTCRVSIRSRSEPVGISEKEWRDLYTQMELTLIDVICQNVAALSAA